MSTFETQFTFDELQIPDFGEGVLFYGEATLSDDQGETDHFVITDIRLNGGVRLNRPPHDGGGTLSQRLFKAISDVLYNDAAPKAGERPSLGYLAAHEWADFISGEVPPVPMFRPRAGLLSQIVRGASLGDRS